MSFETIEDVEEALDRWLRVDVSRKCVTGWNIDLGYYARLTSRSELPIVGQSTMSSNDAIANALLEHAQPDGEELGTHDQE